MRIFNHNLSSWWQFSIIICLLHPGIVLIVHCDNLSNPRFHRIWLRNQDAGRVPYHAWEKEQNIIQQKARRMKMFHKYIRESSPIVPPVYKTSTFDSFLKSNENCLSKAAKTWLLFLFFWHKFKSCSPMLPERIRVLGTLLLSIDAFFGLSLLDWFDSWRIGDLQEIYLLRDLEYYEY